MTQVAPIAIVGTFDSKSEEHLFLRENIRQRGFETLTVNVGTKAPSPFSPDMDLYPEISKENPRGRDNAIEIAIRLGQKLLGDLYQKGLVSGMISAGGGTGTHLGTSIMRALPLGVPKVMVSTVASRDMSKVVGTKDITMMHSVVDILGINSISGIILENAAGAICGMVGNRWRPGEEKKRIALTFFGFITPAAEAVRGCLEGMGYEVIPFHANGTGGMAMEELAEEGRFHGILDLATHELADELMGGYCKGIGTQRLRPASHHEIPRLVVPGGLDCAVLEFTRNTVPQEFKDRQIFFYDFRSAIRLNLEETLTIADQVAERVGEDSDTVRFAVPLQGWSVADQAGGPLHNPPISKAFMERLKEKLDPRIRIAEADLHINDAQFAGFVAQIMDRMIRERWG